MITVCETSTMYESAIYDEQLSAQVTGQGYYCSTKINKILGLQITEVYSPLNIQSNILPGHIHRSAGGEIIVSFTFTVTSWYWQDDALRRRRAVLCSGTHKMKERIDTHAKPCFLRVFNKNASESGDRIQQNAYSAGISHS